MRALLVALFLIAQVAQAQTFAEIRMFSDDIGRHQIATGLRSEFRVAGPVSFQFGGVVVGHNSLMVGRTQRVLLHAAAGTAVRVAKPIRVLASMVQVSDLRFSNANGASFGYYRAAALGAELKGGPFVLVVERQVALFDANADFPIARGDTRVMARLGPLGFTAQRWGPGLGLDFPPRWEGFAEAPIVGVLRLFLGLDAVGDGIVPDIVPTIGLALRWERRRP